MASRPVDLAMYSLHSSGKLLSKEAKDAARGCEFGQFFRECSPNTTEVRRVVAKSGKNHQEHKEHEVKAKIYRPSHIPLARSACFVNFVPVVVEVLFDFRCRRSPTWWCRPRSLPFREFSPNTAEVRRVVAESGKNHQEHEEHKVKARIDRPSHIPLARSAVFVNFVPFVVEVLFDFRCRPSPTWWCRPRSLPFREFSPSTTEVRRVVAESGKNHQEHKEHKGKANIYRPSHIPLALCVLCELRALCG